MPSVFEDTASGNGSSGGSTPPPATNQIKTSTMKALIITATCLTIVSLLGLCVGLVMQDDAIVIASASGVLLAWAMVTTALLIELINEYK